jgi:hypothetical protein
MNNEDNKDNENINNIHNVINNDLYSIINDNLNGLVSRTNLSDGEVREREQLLINIRLLLSNLIELDNINQDTDSNDDDDDDDDDGGFFEYVELIIEAAQPLTERLLFLSASVNEDEDSEEEGTMDQ